MFTSERIMRLCPNLLPDKAEEFAAALELYKLNADLTTPLRCAHFMGQMAYESSGFTQLVENLDYNPGRIRIIWPRLSIQSEALAHNPEALANVAYEGILGNGSEVSGDGWKFRGRGIIQITGRSNYSLFGARIGIDILNNPDLAAEPEPAVKIALEYWKSRKCNDKADKDDSEGVTRCINGAGLAGLADRKLLTEKAKAIFTVEEPLIS